MSLVKKLAGQTVIYGIGNILPRILHYVVFNSYLTYKVGRVDYSIYLSLYAYASILLVIFSYRMDTAMFRFGKEPKDLPRVYSTALIPMFISSAILIALGYTFADQITDFLTYPGRGYYVKLFCWIIAFDVIALLPYAKYRLESKPKSFVGFKLSNVFITVMLVLGTFEVIGTPSIKEVLPFIKADIDLVFIANLIASAIICIGLLIKNRPAISSIDWKLWRKMVGYAWPLIIVGIAASINQFFAVPLQKFFLGEAITFNKEQSAIYGAAQKIASLLAMFTTAYNYAAEPFFFKHSDRSDAKQLYGEIALFFVISAGVISLGIYLFLDAFQFIVGPDFRQAMYLIPVLLLAYLFLGIYYNVSIWYKLSDRTWSGAIIASFGAIITLAGSIFLLPVYGIAASAWVALGCYFVMVVFAYLWGQKVYPISYPVGRILAHIAIIIIFFSLSFICKQEDLWLNFGIGIFLFASYSMVIYSMEKKRIKGIL